MATTKSLAYSRDYKRRERETNPSFVQKEKVYRKTYAKRKYAQAKLAMAFCQAVPDLFKAWMREGSIAVAPSSAVPPQSRILPVPEGSSTSATAPMFTPMPATTVAGRIPSAAAIEGKRLQSAGINHLAELGIRLD
jgi:hypothetical protein